MVSAKADTTGRFVTPHRGNCVVFARRALRLLIVCLVGLGLLSQPFSALASACRGAEGKTPRACCGCCAAAARPAEDAKPSCCRKSEAATVSRGCCAPRSSAKPATADVSALAGLHECCCSGSSDPAPALPTTVPPAGSAHTDLLLAQLAPLDLPIIIGIDDGALGSQHPAPPPIAGRALLPRLCLWRI